jgi:molybdopterin converting factor small subunit
MAEMIRVTVMLVGRAAELADEPRLEYALTPPAALSTVLELMALRRPSLGELLPACTLSVNGGEVDVASILSDGDEVTICPCD